MNSDNYSVFRNFTNIEQARDFAATLKEIGIEAELVHNSNPLDGTIYSGDVLISNSVQLKIHQKDFAKANAFLDKEADNLTTEIEDSHYLHSFSDEELYEILMKPDEWSNIDYKIAHKLLIKKGKQFDPELLNALKKQRIDDLAKPEASQKAWILFAYIMTALGGLSGIFIGWHIMTYKKSLPNGQKTYAYAENDRKHGKAIFIIGLIIFPIIFIITLYQELKEI